MYIDFHQNVKYYIQGDFFLKNVDWSIFSLLETFVLQSLLNITQRFFLNDGKKSKKGIIK